MSQTSTTVIAKELGTTTQRNGSEIEYAVVHLRSIEEAMAEPWPDPVPLDDREASVLTGRGRQARGDGQPMGPALREERLGRWQRRHLRADDQRGHKTDEQYEEAAGNLRLWLAGFATTTPRSLCIAVTSRGTRDENRTRVALPEARTWGR